MRRSAPLQVVLLLTLGATAVDAKEPNAVMGVGAAVTCKAYVAMVNDKGTLEATMALMLAWTQGYFSARNIGGRYENPLAVGGTVSGNTLQAMLADQCQDEDLRLQPLVIAVDRLYNKLKQKGL